MADNRPFEVDQDDIFHIYPYLKPHILFYGNVPAIRHIKGGGKGK